MLKLNRTSASRQSVIPLPSTTLGNSFDQFARDKQIALDERAAVRVTFLGEHGVSYRMADGSYLRWINGYSRAWRAHYSSIGKVITVDSFPAWPRVGADA